MNNFTSRSAAVPGSSFSDGHHGYWSERIKLEGNIYYKWYREYGHLYLKNPSDPNANDVRKGPFQNYVPPVHDHKYMTNIPPSQPVAYLNACIAVKQEEATALKSIVNNDDIGKCSCICHHTAHTSGSQFSDRPFSDSVAEMNHCQHCMVKTPVNVDGGGGPVDFGYPVLGPKSSCDAKFVCARKPPIEKSRVDHHIACPLFDGVDKRKNESSVQKDRKLNMVREKSVCKHDGKSHFDCHSNLPRCYVSDMSKRKRQTLQ